MKKIILKYDSGIPAEEFKELFQAALNYNFFDIFVDSAYYNEIKDIKRIRKYSTDIELNPDYLMLDSPDDTVIEKTIEQIIGKNINLGARFFLSNKNDEKQIIMKSKKFHDLSFIIVKIQGTDWKIIPFENLIAEMSKIDTQLYAEIESIDEAETLFKTLERGVDGVLYRPKSANDLLDLKSLTSDNLSIPLSELTITAIKEIPKADRVCVDTTSMLLPGEGMLIGSTAKGFGLVHAEVFDSEFVNSRPFRVNAGDVSAYIIVPDYSEEGKISTRTNYLSELKAGDEVFVVNKEGDMRIVTVGRVKIETRPMILFKVRASIANDKRKQDSEINTGKIDFHFIIQNAETVRLISADGDSVSCVKLKEGDKIIGHIGPGATHFGTSIKETIIEK